MNQVIDFVFSASGALAAFLAGVVWLSARRRSRTAHAFLVLTCTAYVTAAVYAIAYGAAAAVGFGYHPIRRDDVPPGRIALVVLGSGDLPVFGWSDTLYIPTPVAAARVLETARVYRLLNPDWVISSGGNLNPADSSEPSAKSMRDALVRLGVPAAKILLEATSRTTHDEAVAIAPMLRSLGAAQVVLVTSAIHMRRSMGAFRAEGITPVPAVAPDPWFRLAWREWLIPSSRGLGLSAQVTHEVLGLVYYWTAGWWR